MPEKKYAVAVANGSTEYFETEDDLVEWCRWCTGDEGCFILAIYELTPVELVTRPVKSGQELIVTPVDSTLPKGIVR